MKNWLNIKNGRSFAIKDVPVVIPYELREDIIKLFRSGMRPVQFFGRETRDGKKVTVTAVLADYTTDSLWISSARIDRGGRYGSITSEAVAFRLFERELYEQTGIIPEGHPWLKAVRYEHGAKGNIGKLHDYPYLEMFGDETHEVAVGPVHAGVIEPGSFRFLCHGEDVYHLEIQLGYQHRGVEGLFKKGHPAARSHLAESIAGDSATGHSWAYALGIEALSDTKISGAADIVRAIMLELERIGMHLAGLGGIATDIGFLPGASVYGRIRTAVINTMLKICGCRFGRGLIRPGGVSFGIDSGLLAEISATLEKVENDARMINDLMFNSPSVLSRLEHTGTVSTEYARKTGLVGIMAKMAGLPVDSRVTHPIGVYQKDRMKAHIFKTGDVYARARIRAIEIEQSIGLITNWLNHDISEERNINRPGSIRPEHAVVALIEGWRGEICHVILTDGNSNIRHYKVVDPSFHNWTGLALAVRGNGISDFPLCNKSFDQSYCGFDL